MMTVMKRPGGEVASRPLHFIFLADCSGSMGMEAKIQSLNNAIKEAIPHMRTVAQENVNAQVLVRAIKFQSGASWHVANPTPVDQFEWNDLRADGLTDLGLALSMVADEMKMPPMDSRALPPVLVLISDGQPTDDFQGGLKQLLAQPWGKKAVKMAIAIGGDADYDILQQFIDNVEIKPLHADNPEALTRHIKWVSTAVLQAASAPPSQTDEQGSESSNTNVPIPRQPKVDVDDAGSVW
jgi:uncharacterized protein YegL